MLLLHLQPLKVPLTGTNPKIGLHECSGCWLCWAQGQHLLQLPKERQQCRKMCSKDEGSMWHFPVLLCNRNLKAASAISAPSITDITKGSFLYKSTLKSKATLLPFDCLLRWNISQQKSKNAVVTMTVTQKKKKKKDDSIKRTTPTFFSHLKGKSDRNAF